MCCLVMSSNLLSYLVFHSLFHFSKFHSNYLKDDPKFLILINGICARVQKIVVQKMKHKLAQRFP